MLILMYLYRSYRLEVSASKNRSILPLFIIQLSDRNIRIKVGRLPKGAYYLQVRALPSFRWVIGLCTMRTYAKRKRIDVNLQFVLLHTYR